jgi:Flp pilus assembly pilin Flp
MFVKLYAAIQSRLAESHNEKGAVSVEYVLLVAAIAAAIIAGTLILGPKITAKLGSLL